MFKKLSLAIALGLGLLLAVFVCIALADGPIVDLDNGEEDYRVIGVGVDNYLGEAASGDINGDGIGDLIIGASGTDLTNPTRDNAGAVHVIWGTSDGLSGTLDLASSFADLTIYSPDAGFAFGHFMASGDINDDGTYDDLIIGADYASVNGYDRNGAVYVLFASSSLSDTIDLYTDTVDLEIYGAASYDHLGRSIASCDVSGDGVSDLIIGAYQYDRDQMPPVDGRGAVYVIFGATNLSGTIELDSGGADFAILGDDDGDRLGRSVACGDVDGDGTADIIAGAYRADQTWGVNAGEVYVVYGDTGLSGTLDLSSESPDVLLRGVAAGDEAGFYVASGNINGDGYNDLLIGAYFADVDWPDSETGAAYVVYGSDSLSATMNLSETANITIYGAAEDDRLSRSLTSGDFNGDGYDDILVGASRADPAPGRENAGISYVIYGALEITSTIYLSDTNLIAIKVLGDDTGDAMGDESGRASGSGDLDGDGADDLLIGAVLARSTSNDTNAGEAYVVHGSKAITLTVNPASATITAGQSMTYTATASNKFGGWDVTSEVIFNTASAAGGAWSDNVYTSEKAGTWVVTGTFQSLVATATLTVNSGALHHFAFYPISNQTVGQPFSVRITAQDEYENTVTGYTGSAGLTDTTGTISPTMTGNFIDGVWMGDVTITQAQSGVTITAQDGSMSGTSNSFDVAATGPHIFLPVITKNY